MSDKRIEITGDAESGVETNAEKNTAETKAAEGAKKDPGNLTDSNDGDKGFRNPELEKSRDGGGLTHK